MRWIPICSRRLVRAIIATCCNIIGCIVIVAPWTEVNLLHTRHCTAGGLPSSDTAKTSSAMSFAGLLANYKNDTGQGCGVAQSEASTPDEPLSQIPGGKLSDDRKSLMLTHKLLPSLTTEARLDFFLEGARLNVLCAVSCRGMQR